jgi:hypothetical protein
MTKVIAAAIVIGLFYPLIRSRRLRTRDEKGRIIGPGWLTALIVTVGLFLSLIVAAVALSADNSRFTFLDEVAVVILKTPVKYNGQTITALRTKVDSESTGGFGVANIIVGKNSLWLRFKDLNGTEWLIPKENVTAIKVEYREVEYTNLKD